MKGFVCFLMGIFTLGQVYAQDTPVDTTNLGKVTITKDPRLTILQAKELEFNTMGTRLAKGYRLLVLKSNDRNYSMKVRALLLQNFPDQKVYMAFQAPFIKLKFGNFTEKAEAEKYRDMIMRGKYVTNNIYVVPEVVEVKPDKSKENGDE